MNRINTFVGITLVFVSYFGSVPGWALDLEQCERVIEPRAAGTFEPADQGSGGQREDWQGDPDAWKEGADLETDRLDFSGGRDGEDGNGGSENWRGDGEGEGEDPFELVVKRSLVDGAREELIGLLRGGASSELVRAKRAELIDALHALYLATNSPEDYSHFVEMISHMALNGFDPDEAGSLANALRSGKPQVEKVKPIEAKAIRALWESSPGLLKEIRALVFTGNAVSYYDSFLNLDSPDRLEGVRESTLALGAASLEMARGELEASIGMEGAVLPEETKRGIMSALKLRSEKISTQPVPPHLEDILPYVQKMTIWLTDQVMKADTNAEKREAFIVWWGAQFLELDRALAGSPQTAQVAPQAEVPPRFSPAPLLDRIRQLSNEGRLALARSELLLATKQVLIHSGSEDATVEMLTPISLEFKERVVFNNRLAGAEYLVHDDAEGAENGKLYIALSYLRSAVELLTIARSEPAPEGYSESEWGQALELQATYLIRKAKYLAGRDLERVYGLQRMLKAIKDRLVAWEKLRREDPMSALETGVFGTIETVPGELLEPLQDLRVMRNGELQLPTQAQLPGLYRTEVEKIVELMVGPETGTE